MNKVEHFLKPGKYYDYKICIIKYKNIYKETLKCVLIEEPI